jgi:signal transduction histidine kinase
MKIFGVEVLVRLFDNKKMVGIALLKSREDATSYSAEEYLNLKQIFSNVTIALGRSLLFEEIQVFNKSLQEKIEIATKDLRNKNQDLKTLRDRERDMMDIVGHELRTPLSIIKMKLGLLAMKIESMGKITKDEFLKQYSIIMEAIQRESRLLETMISSTKIDSKHLEINFEKLNIIAALNDSMEVQIGKAVQKGISLTLKNELKDYFVLGDKVRLPEIFDNLIGNAIKYTDKGSVNIETKKTKDGIEITIKDTGIGIPSDSIRHLGTKFYRVGQYIENEEKSKKSSITHIVRPGGTGLGLYVTFGLVKLMKGTIKVESKLGSGSVFTLFLPQISGKTEKNKTVVRSKNVFDQLGLHKNNNNI